MSVQKHNMFHHVSIVRMLYTVEKAHSCSSPVLFIARYDPSTYIEHSFACILTASVYSDVACGYCMEKLTLQNEQVYSGIETHVENLSQDVTSLVAFGDSAYAQQIASTCAALTLSL